ncbi:MAG: hypothetical protein AAGB31_00060 [Bdellovibrio sp.]
MDKNEVIYRCALNKSVPYSAFFSTELVNLNYRIQQMERVLESMEPFYKKVHITLLQDRPFFFRVQGNHVYLGTSLLQAPGHLEKALAKVWYRERSQTFFAQQALLEEVFTDFLLYLEGGTLMVGDPRSLSSTSLQTVRWPSLLKSPEAYCDSPWKLSEHYAICAQEDQISVLADQVGDLSLRPLLTVSWIRSYLRMGVRARFELTRNLSRLLKTELQPALPLTVMEEGLFKSALAVTNISSFAVHAGLSKELFNRELQKGGFEKASLEAFFDVLYVSPEPVQETSSEWQELEKLARKNPQMQIAILNSEKLWMLPSKYPVAVRAVGELKATRTIVSKCGQYDFAYVMQYAAMTEKLLIVNSCGADKIQYAGFILEGVEGFGSQNKGIGFVQFHLPSLLMKKTELESVVNVLDFLQKRDPQSQSFLSLGWQDVQWNKKANAYQPKAFIDAIEWYRLPQKGAW